MQQHVLRPSDISMSAGLRKVWQRLLELSDIPMSGEWWPNNSSADCSISVSFTTNYEHVTPDVPQTFKVKGQGHSIT